PDNKDAFSVSCNLHNSSVELVDWLVSKGHKRIGFIKGPDAIVHSGQRLSGYYEGLKKHNIKHDTSLVGTTDLSSTKTNDAMHKLLALKNRPDAVMAFNDYVALDAIKYTKSKGLKVNKDIVFVSYANLPVTSYMDNPPIASVEQFPYQQAEKATRVLLQIITSGNMDAGIPRKTLLES